MRNLGTLINDYKDVLGYGEYIIANTKIVNHDSKKKTNKITDSELSLMLIDLKNKFKLDETFANSDLADLCEKWGLTNRQTPSRLKKLSEAGALIRFETKPLTYKIKG